MSAGAERCGEALPRLLAEYGVRTVFGIPGNHTLELYRGLAASGLRHVTTRHEQGAAFMADGYARATGHPGVCFLISGPGLLNAATAMAQALADSIPMLVITAVGPSDRIGRGLGDLHELPDQQAAARAFSALSLRVTAPETLPGHLQTAFTLFASGRPGPVHIEIPMDVMAAVAGAELQPLAVETPELPADAELQELAAALEMAEAPLLMLGGGALAGPWTDIAERLGAPVLNTVNAKGVVPWEHPLAVGGSPSLPSLRAALAAADVVLAVGTEFGETDYDLLMEEAAVQIEGVLLRVDIDPEQLPRHVSPDVAVAGDAAAVAEGLLALLPQASAERRAAGAQRAESLRDQVVAEEHFHEELAAFFATLERALGDACIVGDSTRPTYYATWMLERRQPRRYFHSVSGFGTLGYALPAACGAALGIEDHPDDCTPRHVLALIGDGGAQFTLTELATAMDAQLPVIFLIWQNAGYEEIANSLAGRGVPADSTLISAPQFDRIAEAYGMPAYSPGSHMELEAALGLAATRTGPALIVVRQEDFVTLPSGQWYG